MSKWRREALKRWLAEWLPPEDGPESRQIPFDEFLDRLDRLVQDIFTHAIDYQVDRDTAVRMAVADAFTRQKKQEGQKDG
jgi:hypothetical protein